MHNTERRERSHTHAPKHIQTHAHRFYRQYYASFFRHTLWCFFITISFPSLGLRLRSCVFIFSFSYFSCTFLRQHPVGIAGDDQIWWMNVVVVCFGFVLLLHYSPLNALASATAVKFIYFCVDGPHFWKMREFSTHIPASSMWRKS